MGMAPEVTTAEEWIPVDAAARTLVTTALSHPDGGLFTLQPGGQVRISRLIELAAESAPLAVKPTGQFIKEVSELFPETGEVIGALFSKSGDGVEIDDAGIGPFEIVPADGVSDDLLRRYLRVWAPEAGDPS
jgi:hypothetical protein